MRVRWHLLLILGGWLLSHGRASAAMAPVRLSRTADTYFMEDDQVYARFLWFRADGSYRQINRDRASSEEVDRGTWAQAASGEVSLQPTNGMLAYRALSAGPLLITLTTQRQIDGLGALRQRMAVFLEANQDVIFAGTALTDLDGSSDAGVKSDSDDKAHIMIPGHTDTFNRNDLEDLLRQVDVWVLSKRTKRVLFDLVAPVGWPPLLLQRGAVFSGTRLPEASAEAAHSKGPPFYFAQVSRRFFVREAGTWKPFENLGGLHEQASGSKLAP